MEKKTSFLLVAKQTLFFSQKRLKKTNTEVSGSGEGFLDNFFLVIICAHLPLFGWKILTSPMPMYRVSHLNMLLHWSYVQGWAFNTFSWLISQIKAKGWANRLVESHFWCCHFWRENSNICYYSVVQTIRIQTRHFFRNIEILWDCI